MRLDAKVCVEPDSQAPNQGQTAEALITEQIWRATGLGVKVVCAVSVVVLAALTMIDLMRDYWAWLSR